MLKLLKRIDFMGDIIVEAFDLEEEFYYECERDKEAVVTQLDLGVAVEITVEEAKTLVSEGAIHGPAVIRLIKN